MTALDFIGFYDPVTRLKTMNFLPDLEWQVCARKAEVRDNRGLTFLADLTGETLEGYDLVFVPGGTGTRTLKDDASFIEWIRSSRPCRYKVSVCSVAPCQLSHPSKFSRCQNDVRTSAAGRTV